MSEGIYDTTTAPLPDRPSEPENREQWTDALGFDPWRGPEPKPEGSEP